MTAQYVNVNNDGDALSLPSFDGHYDDSSTEASQPDQNIPDIFEQQMMEFLCTLSYQGAKYCKIQEMRTTLLVEIQTRENLSTDPSLVERFQHVGDILNQIAQKILAANHTIAREPSNENLFIFSFDEEDNETIVVQELIEGTEKKDSIVQAFPTSQTISKISIEQIKQCVINMSGSGEKYDKIRAMRTILLLEKKFLSPNIEPEMNEALNIYLPIFNQTVKKIQEACQARGIHPKDDTPYIFFYGRDNQTIVVREGEKEKKVCVIQ
ncbi:MAG: hypothetical protein PVI40_07270 [Chlamydiota bacterium]|jgi:hypothetical protein